MADLLCYGGPLHGQIAPDKGLRYRYFIGFGESTWYEREHYWRITDSGKMERVYVWVADGHEAPSPEQVFRDIGKKT